MKYLNIEAECLHSQINVSTFEQYIELNIEIEYVNVVIEHLNIENECMNRLNIEK